MLITFSTSVYPDVVLFGDVATVFLRVMGEKEQPPGILRGEDIRVAIDRLQAWLDAVPPDSREEADEDEPNNSDDPAEKNERRTSVGLKKRAFPLLELMNAAYRKQKDVIWR